MLFLFSLLNCSVLFLNGEIDYFCFSESDMPKQLRLLAY